jgi:hypothetical protein
MPYREESDKRRKKRVQGWAAGRLRSNFDFKKNCTKDQRERREKIERKEKGKDLAKQFSKT